MTTQTILNIVLSVATLYLAWRNWNLTTVKETQRESQEMRVLKIEMKLDAAYLQIDELKGKAKDGTL